MEACTIMQKTSEGGIKQQAVSHILKADIAF